LGLGEADPIKVKEGEQNFQRYAEVLDGNLKGRKFVTGNTLTIADFSIGAWLNLAEAANYPLGAHQEIKRWHAELMELPAWRRSIPTLPA
jgi:glutathione S-transferase